MIVILTWHDGLEKPELEFFPDCDSLVQSVALYLGEVNDNELNVAIYDISHIENDPDVLKPIA